MDRTCCGQPYNYAVSSGPTPAPPGGTCKGTSASGCYPVSYDGRPVAAVAVTAQMDDAQGCFCCDSDDDSVERARLAHEKRKCYKSFAKNVFICALLVSYTFAGALIFLSIEGGGDAFDGDEDGGAVRLAGLMPSSAQANNNNLTAALLAAAGQESRARTVESIWEITVNLNILYRENWTRLAAQELSRFQDDLIRRLSQQMEIESAAVGYHTAGNGDGGNGDPIDAGVFEWNLATSFLYCLSILTTIGK